MKKPSRVIRGVCVECGLRIVGELRPDGRIFPARHPETAADETTRVLCVECLAKRVQTSEALSR